MKPIDRLTRDAARALGDGPPVWRRTRQRTAICRMTEQRRTDGQWGWTVAMALVVLLVLVLVGHGAPHREELRATVGDRPFAADSSLRAEQESRAIVFSDRSRVELAPGTDTRLVRSDSVVQFELVTGRLELAVTPGGVRTWIVIAGPYSIHCTGTQFGVDWDPRAGVLAVGVTEGSVWVRGGGPGHADTHVPAGERATFGKRSMPPSGAPVEVPAAPVVPASLGCGAHGCVTDGERLVKRLDPTWRQFAVRGKYSAALAAAQREGFTALVEKLDVAELDHLAHVARLAYAAGPAREALEAMRRRFPAHARAHGTTFLLGRVALDIERDPVSAAAWFETYLREQAEGELAEEARSRLMEIWLEHGDAPRAEAAARSYLQGHPEGRNVGLARRLLGL